MEPVSLVCFDIGGVLVRIRQSWREAAEGVGLPWPEGREDVLLPGFDGFNRYQADEITYEQYARELADWLGHPEEGAHRLHAAILQEEYRGVAELVAEVKAAGVRTAVLSNTNAPHWADLTDPAKFPTVAGVDHPYASHLLRLAKPDPACYRRFNALTDTQPHQVVFFDDALKNVEAAREIGWRAHRIDPWGDPASQMRDVLKAEGVLH